MNFFLTSKQLTKDAVQSLNVEKIMKKNMKRPNKKTERDFADEKFEKKYVKRDIANGNIFQSIVSFLKEDKEPRTETAILGHLRLTGYVSTGGLFDKSDVDRMLNRLEREGFIRRINSSLEGTICLWTAVRK